MVATLSPLRSFVRSGFIVLLLLSSTLAFAQYEVKHKVQANGAAKQTDGSYQLRGTLGQSSVGRAVNGGYDANIGFWYIFLFDVATGVEGDNSNLPKVYRLDQNRPNPFNPVTQIPFALPEPAHVRIQIFNLSGRLVSVLIDKSLPPGEHVVSLTPERMASGIYFYKLEAGTFTQSRRMVLLK